MAAANATDTVSLRVSNLANGVPFGTNIIFYMLIDPCQPPREVKMAFGTSEATKAVYWGTPVISGSPFPFKLGAIPVGGLWLRMEVPAVQLYLDGKVAQWMQIDVNGGRVWLDAIGTDASGCTAAKAAAPSPLPADEVWIDDDVPSGATSSGLWTTDQAASGTQSLMTSYLSPSIQTSFSVNGLSQIVDVGDQLVLYIQPNGCTPLKEIKISWMTTDYLSKAAWWGEVAKIGGESSALKVGALPPNATWTRVTVPASSLGFEGKVISSMSVVVYGGQAWFDRIGRSTSGPAPARLTSFSMTPSIPQQPAGAALTFTATASASIPPAQYRFERGESGLWTVVQPYGPGNTWTWTPAAADVGFHSVRVSVRNSGSLFDAEDSGLLSVQVTSASGAARAPAEWQLAGQTMRRWIGQFLRPAPPVALSVTGRYAGSNAAGGPTRYSIYSPELNLLSETDTTLGTPAVAYDYIWFAGQPLAQVESSTGTVSWYFNDHLGTPILQTDATGTVVWRAEYEPYGKVAQYRAGAARHQPLRFPGQEGDETGGRAYSVFRWYRPDWGRFISVDPVAGTPPSAQMWSRYSYVLNRPTVRIDATGLCGEPANFMGPTLPCDPEGYPEQDESMARLTSPYASAAGLPSNEAEVANAAAAQNMGASYFVRTIQGLTEGTIVVGGSASAIMTTGGEGSLGIALHVDVLSENPVTPDVVFYGGFGAGLDVGAGLFVSLIPGGFERVRGTTNNVTGSISNGSGIRMYDDTGNYVGTSFSYGPSPLPVSGSTTHGYTGCVFGCR